MPATKKSQAVRIAEMRSILDRMGTVLKARRAARAAADLRDDALRAKRLNLLLVQVGDRVAIDHSSLLGTVEAIWDFNAEIRWPNGTRELVDLSEIVFNDTTGEVSS